MGGEGVEEARARVRVVRDLASRGEGRRAALEQEGWEQERRKELEEGRLVAEVRGAIAGEREELERALRERATGSRVVLKQGVRLVEDMRAARVARQPKVCEVPARENKENYGANLVNQNKGGNKRFLVDNRNSCGDQTPFMNVSVSRNPPRSHTPPETQCPVHPTPIPFNPPPIFKEAGGKQEENRGRRQQERLRSREGPGGDRKQEQTSSHQELELLLARLGELDSTEEVSLLSTILEMSESRGSEEEARSRMQLEEQVARTRQDAEVRSRNLEMRSRALDDVDCVPVRGPTAAEDSAASSISPFPSSRMSRPECGGQQEQVGGRNQSAPSLASVTDLVSRIRQQREAMEQEARSRRTASSLAVFPPVLGMGEGRGGKEAGPGQAKSYMLNKEFIQKVLDFSRSTDNNSTSTNSSSRPEVRVHVVEQSPPSPPPALYAPTAPSPILKPSEKETKLRYYVKKLLKMKHEDIEDLSSASTLTKDSLPSGSSSGSRKQVNLQNG